MPPSYLLDTSALAAHFLGEPGGDFVADCLRKRQVAVCTLTIVEFHFLLKHHGMKPAEWRRVWALCRELVVSVHAIDETVANQAVEIRTCGAARIPLADACIAACAARHGLTLIHADGHFAALPPQVKAINLRTVAS